MSPIRIGSVPAPYGLVMVIALMAVGLTYVGEWFDVHRTGERAGDMARAQVAQVEQDIQASVTATYRDMEDAASRLGKAPALVAALGTHQAGDARNAEQVVRFMSVFKHDPLEAVEVYDVAPTLLAWSGPLIPMDRGPESRRFLDEPVYTVARDGSRRTALVVWVPVRDGVRIVGAIRWMRLTENRVPLRNEYLRDYTWSEEWSRETGLDVSFTFGTLVDTGGKELHSPDGTPIGQVSTSTPDRESILRERTSRFAQVRAFWWVLAGFVLLLGWARYVMGVPPERTGARMITGLVLGSIAVVSGLRTGLLVLDVPAIWQTGKAPMAPLFDPQHLAASVGGGLMETTGDLLVTVLSVAVLAGFVLVITRRACHPENRPGGQTGRLGTPVLMMVHTAVSTGLAFVVLGTVKHAILDSTLDYFSRSGLVPEPLVIVVLASLLVLLLAGIVLSARLLWFAAVVSGRPQLLVDNPSSVLIWAVLWTVVAGSMLSWWHGSEALILVLFSATATVWAVLQPFRYPDHATPVALRIVLPALVLGALVLYPMIDAGMQVRREFRMQDAADAFMEDRDARILFAIGKVLERAELTITTTSNMDSVATALVAGSLAQSLGSHIVTVGIHDTDGRLLGQHTDLDRQLSRSAAADADASEFHLLQAMHAEAGHPDMMIERLTDAREQYRFVYAGFAPVPGENLVVVVRATPRPWTSGYVIPFPRVLVPAGYYGTHYADLSIAEFRDGLLVRTQGDAFGTAFLTDGIEQALRLTPEVWAHEEIRDQRYYAFYREVPGERSGAARTVIAVRELAVNLFDHLYYLLRVIVSGLFIAIPVYCLFILNNLRRPEYRTRRRFRDRVLNAFFGVGIVTVAAMGFVGLRVVTGESERAVESWLRQHLDRVESALLMEAKPGEMPWQVLERMSVDSLAARVGLDLNIYNNTRLERTSRPELVRDRLIEPRLPIEAVEALHHDGFRFVTLDQQLGHFRYTAGFRSLPDERGQPHFVVGIPTLPEQDRMEAERARTLAYLFGALLLLVLVVMFTASILANTLSRPIAQLQAGLRAVAAGHFQRIGPLNTRDEISDLVDSFNTMQDQLEESRSLLAQQERQLAWREMARQVAHEIKNPLTPMKLNIQHLQRAFSGAADDWAGFSERFKRTTSTIIEQINSLARIADEFSSLGRMPTHLTETIDLNAVIREAVELMQHEDRVDIELDLNVKPVLVSGDREAVRRMYINFIKNAIQAVPAGRRAKVGIKTEWNEDDAQRPVLSTITDNGTGIPEAYKERIFVPSFSTKTSGSGLGLAIAKRTVETMEGEIGFETEMGAGTTFWVRLPQALG